MENRWKPYAAELNWLTQPQGSTNDVFFVVVVFAVIFSVCMCVYTQLAKVSNEVTGTGVLPQRSSKLMARRHS